MNKWQRDAEEKLKQTTKPQDKRKCWRITIEPSLHYQYIYVYGNSQASIHVDMGNDDTGIPPTIELYGSNYSLEFDDHVLEEVEAYKIPPSFDKIPF